MAGINRIEAFFEKSGDSYDVPQGVRNAAKRGLELRRKVPKSKKAGLDTRQAAAQGIGSGVARARDLMSGRVSKESIKRMHRYFSRHAKNYKLDPGKKPEDDKGYQAGLLWGGEAGKIWADRMVARFKREEMEKATKVPKKYLSGLSSSAKKERKAEIRRRAKQKDTAGYKDLPGDKGAKTKPSKYSRTQLAAKVRKETKNNTDDEFLRAVAKFTGISKRILRQVHKRGAAAWASGHRPGATQVAWSRARVYSFATGGKTRRTADKDLWTQHMKKGFDEQTVLKALWFTLEFYKARPTKYIRRVPKPGGGYRYYYRESSIGRGFRVGETIKLGDQKITIKSFNPNRAPGFMTVVDQDGKKYEFSSKEWFEKLTEFYGDTYYKSAEKRAMQALRAINRIVPPEIMKRLDALPDFANKSYYKLSESHPEIYQKLLKAFSRAGMDEDDARLFLMDTLAREGFGITARTTLIGHVLTEKGNFAAQNYRQILAASKNLAGEQRVHHGHMQSAIDSLFSIFEEKQLTKKLRKAGEQVSGVLRRITKAKKKGPISPADAQELLKGLLGSEALQAISITAKAVPGFQKNPQVQKIDASLKKAIVEVIPKGVGKKTKVFVAGEGGKPIALEAEYRLVSAKDITPSHDPQSFSPNRKYPKGLQERAYHRDKSEQNKVIRNAQRMNPEFVINTNPDALNGPPIVTEDKFVVLGGNSRTMSMQRIYTEGGAKAKELKDYLRNNVFQMGFTKEDVDAIEDPVVIRVVKTKDQDKKLLVRQMNEGFIQALDPRTMQVAMGRRLDDKAMASLGDAMEDTDTLRSFLDSNRARPFISSLNRAGIIDERNRNQYVNQKTGKMNEDGKTLVERILVGRVVDDPDLLSNTMPAMVGAIARAVPYMVQAETYGAGYNVRDDLRYALQAFNRMNDLGLSPGHAKGKELDRKIKEIKSHFDDLFEGKHPVMTNPRAEAIFDNFLKRGGPRQISSTFKEYAKQASKNPENQVALFGSISPLDVFNQSVTISSKKSKEL